MVYVVEELKKEHCNLKLRNIANEKSDKEDWKT